MKNIEKIMSRNIPEIMEKISCFLCKKQDKLFIKIGLVCESENRSHSPLFVLSGPRSRRWQGCLRFQNRPLRRG